MIGDAYVVFLREFITFRRRFFRYLVSGLVNPLLLLTAFGWGLGRNINLEGVSYLQFVVPGIIALSAMNISFSSVGVTLNIQRRYTKVFENYLVAPIRAESIVIGKVLGGMLRGMFSAIIIIILGILYGSGIIVEFKGMVTILATTFLFSSMGMFVGLKVWHHEDMNTFNTLFIAPMMFLSGTFFSLNNLPGYMSFVIKLLPLTHASLCLRAAMLGREFPLVSFVVLLLFGTIFFLLAVREIKRSSL